MAKRTAGKFARLSLDYFDHPKLASVSDGAIVAHLHMIVYCRKYLTDGRVPKQIASRFESKLLSELAHNDDERPSITINDDGSVTLHDYDEWQETRADLETKSQVRAAAGRKGGRPAKANGKQNAFEPESKMPSKPKAEKEEEEEKKSTSYSCSPAVSERATTRRFDEFWNVYPRKVGKDKARTKYAVAVKRATEDEIIAGAHRLAADPNLPEKQFVPHPSTWLERGGWEDEPLPPRTATGNVLSFDQQRIRNNDAVTARYLNGEPSWSPENTALELPPF